MPVTIVVEDDSKLSVT